MLIGQTQTGCVLCALFISRTLCICCLVNHRLVVCIMGIMHVDVQGTGDGRRVTCFSFEAGKRQTSPTLTMLSSSSVTLQMQMRRPESEEGQAQMGEERESERARERERERVSERERERERER